MFWRKKKEWTEWKAFGMDGNVERNTGVEKIMKVIEKASQLQDQNRRDYNLLFERQNLILKELGKEYVPESSKTEPAKLVDETEYPDNFHVLVSEWDEQARKSMGDDYGKSKPKKKRGRPKKK